LISLAFKRFDFAGFQTNLALAFMKTRVFS